VSGDDRILIVDISFLHPAARKLRNCEIVEQILVNLGDEILFDREMEAKNTDLCAEEIRGLGEGPFELSDEEALAWFSGLERETAEKVRRAVRPPKKSLSRDAYDEAPYEHPDIRIAAYAHRRTGEGSRLTVLTCDSGLLLALRILNVPRRCFKAAVREAHVEAKGCPDILPSEKYGLASDEKRTHHHTAPFRKFLGIKISASPGRPCPA